MQAVSGYWEILRGMVEKEYLIMYPGDVYIVVELTGCPTIRVASHL